MISILLMSIGMILVTFSVVLFIDKIKLLKYSIRAEGEIIGLKKHMSSYVNEDKQIVYITTYRPVIKFIDENNEIRIITYDISSENEKDYKIGDKIMLSYTMNNLKYIEKSEKQIDFSMLCKLISLGIMFIVFSVILWIV